MSTPLQQVKAILGENAPSDDVLSVYLDMASHELLVWVYGKDTERTELPSWLEQIQVMAVVTGVNQRGGEGETHESVDGVTHTFKHDSMLGYIYANAPSYVKVSI